MINAEFVRQWAASYRGNDAVDYFPYLELGRQGNTDAVRRLTEWKFSGRDGRPRRLWSPHEKAFNAFVQNMQRYLGDNGSEHLRQDFQNRAPVWAIFWHHILFATPIFDVYTHMAYHWDVTGTILAKEEARIQPPCHWVMFDRYHVWFRQTLARIQIEDSSITERMLDMALVSWGESQNEQARRTKQCLVRRCRAARER
ncbi:MAG: hypothetical protein JW955_06380 [Sedimentisphaerales bacterium]|nr:hypothetical protein [Sedimentisphaerales bacterium]